MTLILMLPCVHSSCKAALQMTCFGKCPVSSNCARRAVAGRARLGLDAQEGPETVAAPLDLRDAWVLWWQQLQPLSARQVRLIRQKKMTP